MPVIRAVCLNRSLRCQRGSGRLHPNACSAIMNAAQTGGTEAYGSETPWRRSRPTTRATPRTLTSTTTTTIARQANRSLRTTSSQGPADIPAASTVWSWVRSQWLKSRGGWSSLTRTPSGLRRRNSGPSSARPTRPPWTTRFGHDLDTKNQRGHAGRGSRSAIARSRRPLARPVRRAAGRSATRATG
jgi:hypothetical protein